MVKNPKPKYNTLPFKRCLKAANIFLEPSNHTAVLIDHEGTHFDPTLIADHERPRFSAEEIFQGAQDDQQWGTESTVIRHAERWFPAPRFLSGWCSNREHIVCQADSRWHKCEPFNNLKMIIPKPDQFSGFRYTAFTDNQLHKMDLHFARGELTPFAPAPDVYWPFLVVECKKPGGDMGAADDANMLSSSIMIKELVKLYNYSDSDLELDGVILGFSISHDHDKIIFYSHYAELAANNQVVYHRRHEKTFSICSTHGQDAIKACQFIAWIYREWQPRHLDWIRRAIDGLPDTLDLQLRSRTIRRRIGTPPGSWPADGPVSALPPSPTVEDVWYLCNESGLGVLDEDPCDRGSTATPDITSVKTEPDVEPTDGNFLMHTFGRIVSPLVNRKRKWEP